MNNNNIFFGTNDEIIEITINFTKKIVKVGETIFPIGDLLPNSTSIKSPPTIKLTEQNFISLVEHDGCQLKNVPVEYINYNLCYRAIKENGAALRYVPYVYKTEQLCLDAINNNPAAFKYVEKQTEKIIETALKKNPWNLKFVKKN